MIDLQAIKHKTIEEMTDEERIVLLFALNDQALQTVIKMSEIFDAMTVRLDVLEQKLELLTAETQTYVT